MDPRCHLDSFCRRCDVFGHHLIYCQAPENPAMPFGGFIKASKRPPRPIRTRTDSVALACTSRSPVASHNVYDVLDMDTDDDDSDDLDGPPVDPAVLMGMPTLDGTATRAMDTLNPIAFRHYKARSRLPCWPAS